MTTPNLNNQSATLQQQHKVISKMLLEISELQSDLQEINTSLIASTEHTCSQYGDRLLENLQQKLFYFQTVLSNNTSTLNEYKNVLKSAIAGSSIKTKRELDEYYKFCEKSATYIRSKIENYKVGAKKFIKNNCGK